MMNRRLWARVATLMASALLTLFALQLGAQTAPTQQQMDVFKNLPKDQQDAILQGVLGKGGGDTSAGKANGRRTDIPQSSPGKQLQPIDKTRDGRYLRAKDEDPELAPNDTVLVELISKYDEKQIANANADAKAAAATAPGNPSAAAGLAGTQTDRVALEDKRTDAEKAKAEEFQSRISKGNPYRLNRFGVLEVPGLPAIPLAGLTASEATDRVAADPALADYLVTVKLLRLAQFDDAALKPFGYDLFEGYPSTFAPATDIPVPDDYILGPGDSFDVQIYGRDPATYNLDVDRDGRVQFPKLGPISVAGLTFDRARALIEGRVRKQMIGNQVSVSLGDLRTIRVMVVGEAEQPGSYAVSGLSTVTNALFASGGVKKIGSLRHVQLKRNGRLVTELDLYDLLLHGDTSGDRHLLPGDVILIPPIGKTVSVNGEVRRPAVYELKNEKSVAEVVALAGGLTPEADSSRVSIELINASRQRVTQSVDLSADAAKSVVVGNGDKLHISPIRPVLEDSVTLSGYVFRPGSFGYHPGMRVSEVIGSLDELRPNADRHYVMIRRQVPPALKIEVVSADLEQALAHRGSDADVALMPRDQLYVFDLSNDRERVVEPLLKELKLQGTLDAPAKLVTVGGRVKAPGEYPLETGMRVSDLIRAGGSLEDAAYGGAAELTRYQVVNGEARQTDLVKVDLAAIHAGNPAADVQLQPYDYLMIKETPEWDEQANVEVSGEVRFPGKYPIQRGETLHSVLERAGGLTNLSFAQGAIFTREVLKDREKEQIEMLSNRFQSDLTSLSLQALANTKDNSNPSQALLVGQQLISELRKTKPVGRLVIDINQVMRAAPGGQGDVLLKDGDKLMVPKQTQEVTVIGEVQSPTSHILQPGLTRDDYIAKSGGITQKADKRRIYVVRANGSVLSNERRGFFRRGTQVGIQPGDTIVVPLDAERIRPLPLWTAVTTIIYNLAVSVAAIGRL